MSIHNTRAMGVLYCHRWSTSPTCVTAPDSRWQEAWCLRYPPSKSSVAVLWAATCRLLLSVNSTIDRPIRGQQALCQVSAGLPANLATSPPTPSHPHCYTAFSFYTFSLPLPNFPTVLSLSSSPSQSQTRPETCQLSSCFWPWQQVTQTEPETKRFDTLKVNNPQRDPGTLSSFWPSQSFSPIRPRPASNHFWTSWALHTVHFLFLL